MMNQTAVKMMQTCITGQEEGNMNSEYKRVVKACRDLNSTPNGIGVGKLWKYLFMQTIFYLRLTISHWYTMLRYGGNR